MHIDRPDGARGALMHRPGDLDLDMRIDGEQGGVGPAVVQASRTEAASAVSTRNLNCRDDDLSLQIGTKVPIDCRIKQPAPAPAGVVVGILTRRLPDMDDLPGRNLYEVAKPRPLHDLVVRLDCWEEAVSISSRRSFRHPAEDSRPTRHPSKRSRRAIQAGQ